MAAAARSVLRSASIRGGAARVAAEAVAASRPQLRCLPKLRPAAASRFLRSPVEASFCVESLMPMHTATASALLTSMLNVSRTGHGWLSEGIIGYFFLL
ncbi:hypothetical protein B296_00037969 [Ensete ventricosum]|uniref:Protein NUCLEAR FUSION DEFECTIVE 6, chloroplastic/mitochondrial n=1 Tax=Ensete ventricosum TaxID=4639 RepID=A0A426ZXY2_ENSVE|nr:hypothetical protein B296_00037969 [Ensete ventricosum]